MEIQITTIPEGSQELHCKLEQAARGGAAVVDDWFGWSVEELEIEVYTSRSLWIEQHTLLNEEELASWVAGDSGRIIRVVASGSESHLARMVEHECVHFILRSRVRIIPGWLDEGLALYMPLGMPCTYLRELAAAIAQDALIPYELLARPFAVLDRDLKNLAYAQGCGMVHFMAREYGREMIRDVLLSLARGDSMDQALRPFGLNMYLLETGMARMIAGMVEKENHV